MFPLAFVAGWLQGYWWGFISRNYVVWPTFLLMNVFIALKGSHFWFLFFLIRCFKGHYIHLSKLIKIPDIISVLYGSRYQNYWRYCYMYSNKIFCLNSKHACNQLVPRFKRIHLNTMHYWIYVKIRVFKVAFSLWSFVILAYIFTCSENHTNETFILIGLFPWW